MLPRIDYKRVIEHFAEEYDNQNVFDKNGKVTDSTCLWIGVTEETMLNGPDAGFIGITCGTSTKAFFHQDPWQKIHADYQFKYKSEIQHLTEEDYDRICARLEMEYKTHLLEEKENKLKEDF